MKKFDERYVGKDKLVGRRMRLNKFTLEVNEKGYAPLVFFGDVHWGSPQCDTDAVKDMLDWSLKNNVALILMGDLLEASLRDSVGYGVYQQKLQPQEQMEEMIELLQPLADKGLIKTLLTGNHEERITKNTGIDISKLMARILKVPYGGYACWNLVRVGKQNYTIYTTHGSGGSTLPHTKLNSVVKMGYFLQADCVAMGHLHGLSTDIRLIEYVDLKDKMVKQHKQYVVLTGAYLKWAGGYAEVKGMPISKIGSPKAKLRADYHDIHFTL